MEERTGCVVGAPRSFIKVEGHTLGPAVHQGKLYKVHPDREPVTPLGPAVPVPVRETPNPPNHQTLQSSHFIDARDDIRGCVRGLDMVELRLEAAAQEGGHDDQRSETRWHRTTGLLPLLHVRLLLGAT